MKKRLIVVTYGACRWLLLADAVWLSPEFFVSGLAYAGTKDPNGVKNKNKQTKTKHWSSGEFL